MNAVYFCIHIIIYSIVYEKLFRLPCTPVNFCQSWHFYCVHSGVIADWSNFWPLLRCESLKTLTFGNLKKNLLFQLCNILRKYLCVVKSKKKTFYIYCVTRDLRGRKKRFYTATVIPNFTVNGTLKTNSTRKYFPYNYLRKPDQKLTKWRCLKKKFLPKFWSFLAFKIQYLIRSSELCREDVEKILYRVDSRISDRFIKSKKKIRFWTKTIN